MKTARAATRLRVDIRVEAEIWRGAGAQLPEIREAARAAYRAANPPRPEPASLSILLADDAKLKELNGRFRGKPNPTNVLSFPARDSRYLGDIAIAYGVTAREAEVQDKPLQAHMLHLVVHGVLHLLGYDHETARQAREMEALETVVLAGLGIDNPYQSASSKRAKLAS